MVEFDLWFTEDGFKTAGTSYLVERFNKEPIDTLFEYIKSPDELNDIGLDYLVGFATEFLQSASTKDVLELKDKISIEIEDGVREQLLNNIPLVLGSEFLNNQFINNYWALMTDWLSKTIDKSSDSIEATLSSYLPSFNVADRTYFHLVETNEEKYPFGFFTSYTTLIKKKVKHMPLSYALEEFKGKDKQLLHLLSVIFKASSKSKVLSNLIEEGQLFNPTYLKTEEAYELLKNSEYFKECGIGFRFPSWWKKKNKVHTRATIGNRLNQGISLNYLLSVDLNFVLENQTLSEKEIEELLEFEEGLTNFKGKWIEIDHKALKKLLSSYKEFEEKYGNGINFKDYLKLQNQDNKDEGFFDELEFNNGMWLEEFKNHSQNNCDALPLSNDFNGILRKYQKDGYNWLNQMMSLGFGSCLADDMGLGKTVQILALLSSLFDEDKIKNTLLVVPASLVGNWIAEKDKFAPSISIFVLKDKEELLREMDYSKKGLYITTYSMVALRESIIKQEWDIVILDEAQAIKNSNTKQSKAIKSLNCNNRIVMTGTPIENSLMDIWSLFDFINPGLLGNKTEFKNIISKTKDNPKIFSSLRTVMDPFILRRLKTDKKIIKDLPKKIESDYYVELSKKQVLIYKKLNEQIKKSILENEGIAKKGLILSSILKSKQICNHPSQFLKDDSFKEKDSGKFLALKQIVETVKEKKEKVLVFTQYKAMVNPLKTYLSSIFDSEGLSIDGSVNSSERTKRVNSFNNDENYPFMVITIKAGGTGLNLTSANHVIHFDRWWNPSVENQATDRAFRIGQKKIVNVYKFICSGTIEDKINEIILSKKELSTKIIGKGEESAVSWITKMDNSELLELFSYSK